MLYKPVTTKTNSSTLLFFRLVVSKILILLAQIAMHKTIIYPLQQQKHLVKINEVRQKSVFTIVKTEERGALSKE